MFPKIMVSANHPLKNRFSPSILGYPLFLETPVCCLRWWTLVRSFVELCVVLSIHIEGSKFLHELYGIILSSMFEVDEWMICKPEHGEIYIVIVRYMYVCMYVYSLLHRCSGPSMCRIFAHEQQAQHVLTNVAPIYHVVTPCIRLDVAPAEANRNYEPSKRRILSFDVQSVVPKNAARRVVPIKSGVEMELCRAKNLPKLSCSPPTDLEGH